MPPKRKLTLRERGIIYRYPGAFVWFSLIVGGGLVLSPVLYSLTHSDAEITELKKSMEMFRT